MANLETRASYVVGFWRPAETPIDFIDKVMKVIAWMKDHAETYACIVHDLDTEPETGERTTAHVHFVAKLTECRRLLTNINDLASFVGVEPISVTMSKCSSVAQSVRYLVHKDNPEKHQYSISDIVHNWRDDDLQKVMSGKVKEEIDFDFLLNLIRRSKTITEIISVIGLGTYRYWRPVISDMWRDFHG